MVRQPREDIGEPSVRIDVVELCGLYQRVDGGSAVAAFVDPGEGSVPEVAGNSVQLAFSRIIGHASALSVSLLPESLARCSVSGAGLSKALQFV